MCFFVRNGLYESQQERDLPKAVTLLTIHSELAMDSTLNYRILILLEDSSQDNNPYCDSSFKFHACYGRHN